MKARTWGSLAASAVLTLFGCELLVGIRDRSSPAKMDADCIHAVPPQPPSASDGDQQIELQFAVRTLDVGIRSEGGPPPLLGYDLDSVCACPDPPPCMPRMAGDMHCDDPGGRDTAVNRVFQGFAPVASYTLSPTEYSDAIAAGRAGYVIRLQQYNGGRDDPQVSVSVFASDGTLGTKDAGASSAPKWDGNDVWTLDSKTVVSGTGAQAVPVYFDNHAYVTGGVLVAHIDFPLRLVGLPEHGAALVKGMNMGLSTTLSRDA